MLNLLTFKIIFISMDQYGLYIYIELDPIRSDPNVHGLYTTKTGMLYGCPKQRR